MGNGIPRGKPAFGGLILTRDRPLVAIVIRENIILYYFEFFEVVMSKMDLTGPKTANNYNKPLMRYI